MRSCGASCHAGILMLRIVEVFGGPAWEDFEDATHSPMRAHHVYDVAGAEIGL